MNAETQPRKHCHLAWHVTARCNRACPHCLRRTPGQPATDLPHDACVRILESFIEFAANTGREAGVEFSGGNPVLRKDFFDLLHRAHEHKKAGIVKSIRILCNAETLDDAAVEALRAAEVDDLGLSLDGLEQTNDAMRGPGAFQATLNAIRRLVKAGIRPSIKYTLVRQNANQVIDVIKLAHTENAGHFGMSPLILAGGGYGQRDQALSTAEYRTALLNLVRFFDSAGESFSEMQRSLFGWSGMCALLFHELGRLGEYQRLCTSGPRRKRRSGNVLFVVWSDGEVVLRREMQRQGRVPQDSFQKIYDESYLLKLLEDSEFIDRAAREAQLEYVKCRSCPVADMCLPGMAGVFGSKLFFAPSVHCWRKA